MLPIFLATYGAVFVAEIVGDKLLYTTGVLATRYKTIPIMFGMAFAFMLKMAVAVAVVALLTQAPAAFAQAAWHAVLGRFSGEETTAVAFVPGERRHPDLEGAVGAFARAVPIQARVGATRSFAEVLAEIDRARGDALVRQDYAPGGGLGAVEIGFVEYPSRLEQPAGLRLTIERMLHAGPELSLLVMCGADGDRRPSTPALERHAHAVDHGRGQSPFRCELRDRRSRGWSGARGIDRDPTRRSNRGHAGDHHHDPDDGEHAEDRHDEVDVHPDIGVSPAGDTEWEQR